MKKLLILLSIFFVLSACSKLEDLNTNPKGFTSVPAPGIFNGVVRTFFDQMSTFNVNNNNTELYVQHFAETTYPDESHYDMVTRTIPGNHMNRLYRNVLNNLKETKRVIELNPPVTEGLKNNQLAIVEILSVYAWSNIIETFGDMPYTEALDFFEPSPVYDDAEDVYRALIDRLTAAVASMDKTQGGMGAGYDNIFGGEADGTVKWMRFANSLKLRMGLTMADKDKAYSISVVNSAIAGEGVFVPGDKFAMTYLPDPPNQNPVFNDVVASGRDDFVVTSILVDPMNTLNDPRREGFMWTTVGGVYVGGNQGKANSWSSFTHIDKELLTATRESVLMDYAEVEFLLAEAVARTGYAVTGTAASHYDNAVTASIEYWGGSGSDANDYLAQAGVDYTTLIATQPWQQVIGTQAWFAYYMRGMSAWLTWRRLDYPRLIATTEHVDAVAGIPMRYIYPVSEQTLNADNYAAASTAIGGDNAMTRLFWDVAATNYNTLTGK